MDKSYEELREIMDYGTATNEYHRLTMMKNFLVTDGVKSFAEAANAHWFLDIVMSYLPKTAKINDYFFVPTIKVNDDGEGVLRIYHKIDGKKKNIVRQKIPYADLPAGEYKFFLFKEDGRFIMICPKEY
ncbi:MAG: hypothetical protein LBG04_01220 [Holosporaceae bacterium]|jgi:hypothetical protein|nr:hypothetical protein [Holosporaceae bacterium]